MYLAFARVHTGGWDSQLFSALARTAIPGTRFFHVEVVFDREQWGETEPLERESFSCVLRGGCRFTHIDYGDAWELVRLPHDPIQQRISLAYAHGIEGTEYDLAQLVMFPFRPIEGLKREQICASAALLTVQEAGFWRHVKAWQYSPDTLFDLVTAEAVAVGA